MGNISKLLSMCLKWLAPTKLYLILFSRNGRILIQQQDDPEGQGLCLFYSCLREVGYSLTVS